ncbi:elongation factor Ts [Patescibacteria group bacterium]|uniref:Elongation factor Ts n=1 Tax=candidate division WWE3 bacterium TaxID=2053526 RepID=A0A928Y5R2_UNCKA|nr:elongation factor Ts [candidate division WWE3 bacterium]MCL4732358.1 elongation factor Ts [Patescibacteria group bacterium]MDL1952783.1 elongation factor Ts [Candidatus Uhrbacteria bacterium UHB]RIL01019.1 MAG: elongation factor Ts [Candidatus Uhrbacteria bacterium]
MIDAKTVADLRARTGAGIVDCKKALEAAGGDMEKAVEELRKSGAMKAAKKSAERETAEGLIHAYIHSDGKIGAMIELQCETDFVARNADFRQLAHDLAMQIVATDPEWISPDDIPAERVEAMKSQYQSEIAEESRPEDIKRKIVEGKLAKWYEEATLMKQPWVKDDSKTIESLIQERIATIGEKIVIARFVRYRLSAEGKKVC